MVLLKLMLTTYFKNFKVTDAKIKSFAVAPHSNQNVIEVSVKPFIVKNEKKMKLR